MDKLIVGYIRVSTDKQEKSGLGLEAQERAINEYAEREDARFLRFYREVESGRRNNRPELQRALGHARRSGATLVIAKLDRLGRNLHFVSGLMEAGVDFVCCDNPHVTPVTIHILAAIAEDEAKRISERTKTALAALKARGVKLGSQRDGAYQLSDVDRQKAAKAGGAAVAQRARECYSDIIPQMQEWRESGMSLQAIANMLTEEGHTTRNGKTWSPTQVRRVLLRYT